MNQSRINMLRLQVVLILLAGASLSLTSKIALGVVKDKQGDEKQDKPKEGESNKEKDKPRPTTRPWQKVKTFSGTSKTGQQKNLKFLVTTKEWRLTLTTEAVEGTSGARVRVTLMAETRRDQDGEPVNWRQLEVLYDGDTSGEGKKGFQDGLGEDGKPKWFELVVSGHATKYHIVVEDRGEKRGKSD